MVIVLLLKRWNASVAQWIEQCPPEACASVRLRSDASNMSREDVVKSVFTVLPGFFIFRKGAEKGKTIKFLHP